LYFLYVYRGFKKKKVDQFENKLSAQEMQKLTEKGTVHEEDDADKISGVGFGKYDGSFFFNSRLATPPPFAHPLDLDSRLCVRVRVCVGTIFDRKTLAAMTVTTTSGKLDGQLDLPPPELPQLGHKSEQKTSSEEKDKEKSKKDKKDKKEKKRDKERNEEGESRDSRHHHYKHQDDGSEDKPRRHSEDDRREKHSDDRNDRDRNRHRDPDRRDRDREHGREHDRDRDRPRRDRSRSRSRERHHEKKSERDRSRSPRR